MVGLLEPAAAVALLIVYGLVLLVLFSHRDATAVLTVYVVIIIGLPSDVVIKGWGGVGNPSTIFGLVALVWWGASRIVSGQGAARGFQPVRVACYVFLGTVIVSYAAAFARPISGLEASGANRGLVQAIGMVGVALLCADGVQTRDRLDRLLRRLTFATAALAAVGIMQFATGVDITAFYRHIPGFSFNLPANQFILERANFRRVQGTAAHPIEFGVVLAMALPVALHYAMHNPSTKKLGPWLKVALIGFAIPMSLTRSAFVGLAVAGVVLLAGWNWRQRLNALIVAATSIGLVRIAIPGLVGTIVGSFVTSSTDPSVIHRQQDLARVGPLIQHSLILGRGIGTYIPSELQTSSSSLPSLDNQYLGSIVETGIVGLLGLVTLLLTSFFTARGARRRSADPATRDLGQCLAASAAVALVTYYTFDAFSFQMASGMTFLILGAAGALWRLAATAEAGSTSPAPAAELGDARGGPALTPAQPALADSVRD